MKQVAPIWRQRINAAGPGKFSARLSTRTPLRGVIGLGVEREAVVAEGVAIQSVKFRRSIRERCS